MNFKRIKGTNIQNKPLEQEYLFTNRLNYSILTKYAKL